MSLDQNLFTLAIATSTEEAGALDLTDPNTNTIYYRKRPNPPTPEFPYNWGLWDPTSEGLLCTVTAPGAASKQKTIELHNPDVKIDLSFAGSFTFKWAFKWEDHTFEWKRESCYLNRKPDPPVQVAVTREPAGRIKTSQVQLLDYNLNRFDIEDRKGLEIVMLAALLTFQDYSDEQRAASNGAVPASRQNSDGPLTPVRSGTDIVTSLQYQNKAQQNDVIVGEDGQVDDYANHCVQMLKDPSMVYIVLRPQSPEHVTKVVQVAEATKRFHYKSGRHDETLHQYVTMAEVKQPTGPKVIKLDDDHKGKKGKEYKPPQTLTVHLSKIPMPELQPKAKTQAKHGRAGSSPPRDSSLRPGQGKAPGKSSRTPSPSRPGYSSNQSSSSSANQHHKLSKPQQPQQHQHQQQQQQQQQHQQKHQQQNQPQYHSPQPQQAVNPYRYQQILHPPTGPPPNMNAPSDGKSGKKKDDKRPQPPNGPPYSNQWNSGPTTPSGPSNTSGTSGNMPGAWPGTAPNGNYNNNSSSSTSANSNSNSNAPPPQYTPPSNPPPSFSASLTNGIANVGYNLLDRLTHKNQQPPARP